jgi:hypothetical protein
MRFGFENRKHLTGTDLYVRVMQIAALLPAVYLITIPGYPAITTQHSVLSVLFDLGFSVLPRIETLALSLLYRATASEIAMYFAMLIAALVLGLAAKKLLDRAPRTVRLVFAALIAVDLILRLLPLRFNAAFGLPCAIAGFGIRLGCLALILLDLRAAKQMQ